MKPSEVIAALSALASEPRLTVYRLLVKRGPKGYTPSELTERLELPAPTLSFHLKGLLQAGLVGSRRDGRNLYYRPNFERMNGLVAFLTENCCSLADEICGPTCQPQSPHPDLEGRQQETLAAAPPSALSCSFRVPGRVLRRSRPNPAL